MNNCADGPSFFIGWDVGGWNCDKNKQSRDAIVILDDHLMLVGQPWRGNLRESIATSCTIADWVQLLFHMCKARQPLAAPSACMAIDTPLGFSVEFTRLITGQGYSQPDPTSGRNCYLFRQTERFLFDAGKKPLSAIKDMIGSQATKGMHFLAKFAIQVEACGVWASGDGFRAIETYPAPCRNHPAVTRLLRVKNSLGNGDKDDALICALIAYLFAKERARLEPPPSHVPASEGWIWLPRAER